MARPHTTNSGLLKQPDKQEPALPCGRNRMYCYISRCDSLSLVILIEIIPHPKIRGHWLVKSLLILPYPIWYKNKEDAVSYAEWLAAGREAEIKIRESTARLSGQ